MHSKGKEQDSGGEGKARSGGEWGRNRIDMPGIDIEQMAHSGRGIRQRIVKKGKKKNTMSKATHCSPSSKRGGKTWPIHGESQSALERMGIMPKGTRYEAERGMPEKTVTRTTHHGIGYRNESRTKLSKKKNGRRGKRIFVAGDKRKLTKKKKKDGPTATL